MRTQRINPSTTQLLTVLRNLRVAILSKRIEITVNLTNKTGSYLKGVVKWGRKLCRVWYVRKFKVVEAEWYVQVPNSLNGTCTYQKLITVDKYERICPLSSCILQKRICIPRLSRIFQKRIFVFLRNRM